VSPSDVHIAGALVVSLKLLISTKKYLVCPISILIIPGIRQQQHITTNPDPILISKVIEERDIPGAFTRVWERTKRLEILMALDVEG